MSIIINPNFGVVSLIFFLHVDEPMDFLLGVFDVGLVDCLSVLEQFSVSGGHEADVVEGEGHFGVDDLVFDGDVSFVP